MLWYPDDEFLLKAHEIMLKEFGGYPGLRAGLEVFHAIMREVKDAKGVYRKAAILLRRLRTSNIFEDANKRTAYVVTKTFLEMNGEKMWIENSEEVYTFIKDILIYNTDEIAEWLKNGPREKRSAENTSKDCQE